MLAKDKNAIPIYSSGMRWVGASGAEFRTLDIPVDQSPLCAWNSSMFVAFSGHLSSGCHSGNLIASNKKTSAFPSDFHGRAECRLWSGLGPNLTHS